MAGVPPWTDPRMGRVMSTPRKRIVVAVSLAFALLATVAFANPGAAARNTNFSLFGSRSAGWGFTNTTLTTPGPLMQVEVGDNVTLNLTSVDGTAHRWFIDYNNNSAADGSEPSSPNFGTAVLWNFTVSNVTGTFPYRSDRTQGPGDDLANMWGNITIRNATAGGPFGLDVTALALVGGVLLAVVIVALAVLLRRKPRGPKVPPPPPEE